MMHGDALEINNVIQEKPYKPIDSMEVVLSHSGLSSSQLESCIFDRTINTSPLQ